MQGRFILNFTDTLLTLCTHQSHVAEILLSEAQPCLVSEFREDALWELLVASPQQAELLRVRYSQRPNLSIQVVDPLQLFMPEAPRYDLLFHQDGMHRFTRPQIQTLLAQQVAVAKKVAFRVPTARFPTNQTQSGERLLTVEQWRNTLAPFDIEEFCPLGENEEYLLCVLRGEQVEASLLARMQLPQEPLPFGISAIVHTRNEARHIADCLQTLQGWTDEIFVCDMESEDETVEIARRFTENILAYPRIENFDSARNASAFEAKFRWVFYLDADERVPQELGEALRRLALTEGDNFEALRIPFRTYFGGNWLKHLYPGYVAPRLLKNGTFQFNPRLHSGTSVEGRVLLFPADNSDLAIAHYSYDSRHHYLEKMNRYTDGEALNLHEDGKTYHWKEAIRQFVLDFQGYLEGAGAHQDGVPGFAYAFHGGFYRFVQHAKLYERRYREGTLQPDEQETPANLKEMLQYALEVARNRPASPSLKPVLMKTKEGSSESASVVWSAPLLDPSGYGEESRHLVFALDKTETPLSVQVIPWSADRAEMTPDETSRIERLTRRPAAPGFVHIVQNFAPAFDKHPQAGASVGRTFFETDRLPVPWVHACNRMDAIWVATEFNRKTFQDAGVEPEKLAVIPGCFDPTPYRNPAPAPAWIEEIRQSSTFHFLSIFDWTLHKGWDVLLRSFLEAFEGREDVCLLLKVWSTMGYRAEQVRRQAADYIKRELGHDILTDPRIRFLQSRLSSQELISLYQASSAYYLPSRGEGWGRPYMEAMACEIPAIGTNWSGNTAFMNSENSYLIDASVQPVPEVGWREIPTYKGHRWAEPDLEHAKQTLLRVVEERGEANRKATAGQEQVCSQYNHEKVGALIKKEIARLQETSRPHPVPAPLTKKGKRSKPVEPVRVRWEGELFSWHSLGHVNREICSGLLRDPGIELEILPVKPMFFAPEETRNGEALRKRCFAPLSAPADIHVRHSFPPNFEKPESGELVLIQPWEYGYLPKDWIEPIRRNVREVWCYSDYVRQVYLHSGIPEERVVVTPLGVDTSIFRPEAIPYVFTTEPGFTTLRKGLEGKFCFLYVGGTLHRKGIDILLEAYLKGFSVYDNVCLIVKDMGTQTIYKGDNERERILSLTQDATRPPILYLEDDLTPQQLAGIYTVADCLVQPYRGEGFCLPALEAMACGVPVIVPEGGPTDDFVDDNAGWRVPAKRAPFSNSRIGPWECVGETWMFEIEVDDLVRQMRTVAQHPDAAKAKGVCAARKAAGDWTWEQTHKTLRARLQALKQ